VRGRQRLGGVCAGAAYALGWPVWLVRLLWLSAAMLSDGYFSWVYILLWIFLPSWDKTPEDFDKVTGD